MKLREYVAGSALGIYWVSVIGQIIAGCIVASHYWWGGLAVGVWTFASFFVGLRFYDALTIWVQRGRRASSEGVVQPFAPLDLISQQQQQSGGSPLDIGAGRHSPPDPRDDGWGGWVRMSDHSRIQPIYGSRPCAMHEKPDPHCDDCRFSDEPDFRRIDPKN